MKKFQSRILIAAFVAVFVGLAFTLNFMVGATTVVDDTFADANSAFINSQTEVGGFPLLNSLPTPIDTDQDGIPDTWEINNGLNPNDPNDAAQLSPNGYSYLENYVNSNLFAPTVANVSVGGKVLTANGQGIVRVNVTLTNTATSEIRSLQTNSFGYYNFSDIPAGGIYVVTVNSRRYWFANPTQVVNVSEDVGELNFVADN